jgi:hypothetical protein
VSRRNGRAGKRRWPDLRNEENGLEIYVQMKSTIDIVNVVASTKLADAFDLPKIEAELEGAEYNKKKFPGLVYRVTAPKAAFLIFTSGKVVCTGSKCSHGHNQPGKDAQVYRLREYQYGARDPRSEYCGLRRSEVGLELKRHRPGPGPGEHRVRTGAVSWAGLQDQGAQSGSAHLQLRQTGDHGRQIAGRV